MIKPKYPKRGDVSRNVIVEYRRRPTLVEVPKVAQLEEELDSRALKASLGERVAARK